MTDAPTKRAKIQIGTRRANDEWIATHPDQEIPKAVKLRIFDRFGGKCALTGVKLRGGDFDYDHIKRLRDGGEHRETNLHVVWRPIHREKTAAENSDAAKADRIRLKAQGQWPKPKHRLQGQGFAAGRNRQFAERGKARD